MLFSGALWSGAGKLLSMASQLLLTVVLARALPPSEYGLFFIAISSIMILASVGTVGMDQVIVRFAAPLASAGARSAMRRLAIRCLTVVLAATTAVCISLFLLLPWLLGVVINAPGLIEYQLVVLAWLFSATVQRFLAETFRGMHDIRMATLLGGVRNNGISNAVGATLVITVLWFLGLLSLETALLSMLLVSVAIVFAGFVALRRRLRELPDDVGGEGEQVPHALLPVGGLVREGWPLWTAIMIAALYTQSGAWLVSAFDSDDGVALFGVAQRLALVLIAPALVINAVLPPVVATLHASGNMPKLERTVRSLAGLSLLPCAALVVVLLICGKTLLGQLFGDFYSSAFTLLMVLCVGQLINVAAGAWQIVLPMTGRRHFMLGTVLAALFAQATASVALGSYLGVLGVAIGFSVCQLVGNLVGVVLVRRSLGIWIFASVDVAVIKEAVTMIRARLGRGRAKLAEGV
ncbi:MAG: oligosaccharide flippase family protein [Pseudomonadota bacterium]|nr:oligosaccharide flippase family protein [Pseudomonadota bacterium]